jgi:hypothetical protein
MKLLEKLEALAEKKSVNVGAYTKEILVDHIKRLEKS